MHETELTRSDREEVVEIMKAADKYEERFESILKLATDPARQYGTEDTQIAQLGGVIMISSMIRGENVYPLHVSIATNIDPLRPPGTLINIANIASTEQPEVPGWTRVVPEHTHLTITPGASEIFTVNMKTLNEEGSEKPRTKKMTSVDWALLNRVLEGTEKDLQDLKVPQEFDKQGQF